MQYNNPMLGKNTNQHVEHEDFLYHSTMMLRMTDYACHDNYMITDLPTPHTILYCDHSSIVHNQIYFLRDWELPRWEDIMALVFCFAWYDHIRERIWSLL